MDFEPGHRAQVLAQLVEPLARSCQMCWQASQRSTADPLAPRADARDGDGERNIVAGCPYLVAAREPKSLASSIDGSQPEPSIERVISGKEQRAPGFSQGGMRRQLGCYFTQASHDLRVIRNQRAALVDRKTLSDTKAEHTDFADAPNALAIMGGAE